MKKHSPNANQLKSNAIGVSIDDRDDSARASVPRSLMPAGSPEVCADLGGADESYSTPRPSALIERVSERGTREAEGGKMTKLGSLRNLRGLLNQAFTCTKCGKRTIVYNTAWRGHGIGVHGAAHYSPTARENVSIETHCTCPGGPCDQMGLLK